VIQAGNYSTKFRAQVLAALEVPGELTGDKRALYVTLNSALANAQHFLLPEGGRLLDESGRLSAKYAPLLYLPYPVTAFEFRSHDGELAANQLRSSKRIALCFDAKAAKIANMTSLLGEDEFLCIAIFSVDEMDTWAVGLHGLIVSRSRFATATEEILLESAAEMNQLQDAGLTPSGWKQPRVGTEILGVRQAPLSIAPPDMPIGAGFIDCFDELNAAIQTCAALNCQNVGTELLQPSAALNQKRVREGKLPFDSYHILRLTHDEVGRSIPREERGSHASPRQHLRRGHIRHLESKAVWVRSCVVGRTELGQVEKDYKIERSSTLLGAAQSERHGAEATL